MRYDDVRKLQHKLIPIRINHATPATIFGIRIFNTKPGRKSQQTLQSKYQDVAASAKQKEYTCVFVETDDEGITWITLNRPEKRNAMNPTLLVEMEQILYELETEEETKVIVITGAGKVGAPGWI